MDRKIALEEHVSSPHIPSVKTRRDLYERFDADFMKNVERRLRDIDRRLADMDAYGIERAIVSLTVPGVQGIQDPVAATAAARAANDCVAEHYTAAHPDRFSAFATVAIQDPAAAGAELERAVNDLGMCGAMINGYSDLGPGVVRYLDEEPVREFWARVAKLNVPVYLHPREPMPGPGRRIYDGYPGMVGSAWGYALETATHALRLMLSGVFDDHPNLTVILGHLGEGLSYLLPRAEHRLSVQARGLGRDRHKRPLPVYLRNNFYFTTSGFFDTPTLRDAVDAIGIDRVLFSTDYPYEDMAWASDWFDNADIPEGHRTRIGRSNAMRLFGFRENPKSAQRPAVA